MMEIFVAEFLWSHDFLSTCGADDVVIRGSARIWLIPLDLSQFSSNQSETSPETSLIIEEQMSRWQFFVA